jgi:hypothetical protein
MRSAKGRGGGGGGGVEGERRWRNGEDLEITGDDEEREANGKINEKMIGGRGRDEEKKLLMVVTGDGGGGGGG